MTIEPTTTELRLQRRTVKQLLATSPSGMNKDELAKLAEEKGINSEDFEKALNSLLNTGRVYVDDSGMLHQIRTE